MRSLGRHVNHDPRSHNFTTPHAKAPLVSAAWQRMCGPYDQGDLGSCTGNAMAGALMTTPLWRHGVIFTETDAVKLYSAATHIDRVRGVYPPTDTGSSGLAVAKAAKKMGLLASYHHAFNLHDALASLGRAPVLIGIGWFEGFDQPVGPQAELRIAGSVRGGHEVYLHGIDVDTRLVYGCNSWGVAWGDRGHFCMSFDTLGELLADQGDCTILS